jgi:hypothetical protein
MNPMYHIITKEQARFSANLNSLARYLAELKTLFAWPKLGLRSGNMHVITDFYFEKIFWEFIHNKRCLLTKNSWFLHTRINRIIKSCTVNGKPRFCLLCTYLPLDNLGFWSHVQRVHLDRIILWMGSVFHWNTKFIRMVYCCNTKLWIRSCLDIKNKIELKLCKYKFSFIENHRLASTDKFY